MRSAIIVMSLVCWTGCSTRAAWKGVGVGAGVTALGGVALASGGGDGNSAAVYGAIYLGVVGGLIILGSLVDLAIVKLSPDRPTEVQKECLQRWDEVTLRALRAPDPVDRDRILATRPLCPP